MNTCYVFGQCGSDTYVRLVDVLRAVLSLYDGGLDLPLPGTDEVLLCTEQTTAEEVCKGGADETISPRRYPVWK